MPEPLVSIIIPCYNAAPWLEQTLHSALSQTWKNVEIILVDDGSQDNSLSIARSFSEPRLKILTQANAGPSAALNQGLAQARGDFIEYLDADDVLHPEKIAIQLKRLRDEAPDSVASGEWGRFSKNIQEAQFVAEKIWCDLDPVSWLSNSWSGDGMMHGAAWLLPASVVRKAGPWCEDLRLVNDFEYYTRALLCSSRILFCKGARSYYRSGNSGSVSNSHGPKAWSSAYTSFQRGTQALLGAENSARTRKASAITFQSLAYQAWPVSKELVKLAEEEVRRLGGCELPLRSGRTFNLLARCFGWKLARSVQYSWRRRLSK